MNLAHLVHGGQGRPRPPPMPLRRVLEVAADVAAGLALLHPTIVHRQALDGRSQGVGGNRREEVAADGAARRAASTAPRHATFAQLQAGKWPLY